MHVWPRQASRLAPSCGTPPRVSDLENRLRKNLARLGPWAKRERTTAWRLYDRDIPELPWTVDLYGPRVLVQEYVSPVSRRQSEAERVTERERVLSAVAAVSGVPADRIALKLRERHLSVEREAAGTESHEFEVEELGRRFLVNLDDYLDTGLFLDHRAARARIAKAAPGRTVLNLFCYTGAFSVHAAASGATRTVSVDLSPTYLAWAGRNARLNGLGPAHELVRADVFDWLRASRDSFDLVVLDPPTVSRAKKGRSFDVQADHVELVRLAVARLSPGGLLLFSTNARRFALDPKAGEGCDVREVTKETTPPDFRESLHRAWELRRRS